MQKPGISVFSPSLHRRENRAQRGNVICLRPSRSPASPPAQSSDTTPTLMLVQGSQARWAAPSAADTKRITIWGLGAGDDMNPTKCPSACFQFPGKTGLQPPHSTWQPWLVTESCFSLSEKALCTLRVLQSPSWWIVTGLGDGFNCHLHLTDEEADSERQSLILRSLVSGLTLSSYHCLFGGLSHSERGFTDSL